jgi:hypothetical protein
MKNHLGYSPQTEKIYLRFSNGRREDITDEFTNMVLMKFKPGFVHSLKSEDESCEYEITVIEIKKEAGK